jgi:hypothetical protein
VAAANIPAVLFCEHRVDTVAAEDAMLGISLSARSWPASSGRSHRQPCVGQEKTLAEGGSARKTRRTIFQKVRVDTLAVEDAMPRISVSEHVGPASSGWPRWQPCVGQEKIRPAMWQRPEYQA